MCRYDGHGFTSFHIHDGLPRNYIKGIAQDSNGDLWIAYVRGICRFDGNDFSKIPGVYSINAVARDAAGRMWFGGETLNFFDCGRVKEIDLKNWPLEDILVRTNGVIAGKGGAASLLGMPGHSISTA